MIYAKRIFCYHFEREALMLIFAAMSGLIYKTHDVYNFSQLPNPLDVGSQPLTSSKGYDRHEHPHVGLLEYKNVAFPHIHVMDLRWTANNALKLVNEIPTDAVSFVFQISGVNDVTYRRAGQSVRVTSSQHYMVYHPEGEFYNMAQPRETAHQLLVSVDRGFFAASLGCDSAWSEKIQTDLAQKAAFLSSEIPLQSTPRIQQLVQSIVVDQGFGPMRNFAVQSIAMELIAAHIGQVAPIISEERISIPDRDKLLKLKSYLDQHFLKEHSLSQLGRHFLLNEFKLKKGFKALFGVPVFAYLKSLRMDYATSLLKDNRCAIEEVAFLLGYEHAQHFSAAYKKHTGHTPSSLKT